MFTKKATVAAQKPNEWWRRLRIEWLAGSTLAEGPAAVEVALMTSTVR
jgi:hypothetical protein